MPPSWPKVKSRNALQYGLTSNRLPPPLGLQHSLDLHLCHSLETHSRIALQPLLAFRTPKKPLFTSLAFFGLLTYKKATTKRYKFTAKACKLETLLWQIWPRFACTRAPTCTTKL